jgi:hypothetical protein
MQYLLAAMGTAGEQFIQDTLLEDLKKCVCVYLSMSIDMYFKIYFYVYIYIYIYIYTYIYIYMYIQFYTGYFIRES